MSVVKKRKHVSKKNKKAWRKYCDIKDVEDFLEDQRLEERLGKFETKPDEELFVVDTGAAEQPEVDEKPLLSAKLRKRAKLAQTPKCFEILQNPSKVSDPNKKRNHVNPAGSAPTALSKITERKKLEKGTFEKKVQIAKKNRQIELNKRRKAKATNKVFKKDLWGQDLLDSKGIPESLNKEFISPEARLHNVPIQRRLRAKPPPSATIANRKAVEAPHPGVSYNPSFQAHQELLQEVVQHESKMMKKERHLHRVTTNMFRRVTPGEREYQWREEMSAGLEKPSDPAAEPDSEPSDNEYRAINPPVKNKKKDHKARRKQKERLLEKERLRREKVDKKKITDLYKLRQLQSAIRTEEQRKVEERAVRAVKRAAAAASTPPQLNAKRVPLREPDFLPPDQLTGDLRSVSTGVNLLRERYESLQRRGALAPAVIMMKKRRKVKQYFKPGHKVTDEDIDKYVSKEHPQLDVKYKSAGRPARNVGAQTKYGARAGKRGKAARKISDSSKSL